MIKSKVNQLVLALLAATASGQQPNSPSASAVWAGVDGPSWPIVLPLNTAFAPSSITLSIAGAPASPYLLTAAPAGVVQSGLLLPGYGYIDQDLSAGLIVLLDGIGFGTGSFFNHFAQTGPGGQSTWTFPISSALAGFSAGIQSAVVDASTPTGLTLSAATLLTAVHNPLAAVFVSASTGAPANPGTSQAPFASIQAGINAAFAAGPPYAQVFVASGVYSEGLTFRNGVSVHGGYHSSLWFEEPEGISVLGVPYSGAVAQNITLPTTISRLILQAADAPDATVPAASSIGLRVSGSSSALVFEECIFRSGQGGDGVNGADGAATGTNGANGVAGFNGAAQMGGGGGAGSSVGGGTGGAGATVFTGSGTGTNGQPGNGGAFGGAGGAAGTCTGVVTTGSGGGNGACGTPGIPGSGATAASAAGSIVSGEWQPGGDATAGASGGNAFGGGGGGGGGRGSISLGPFGGCASLFAGGGGGGGGARGTGGSGGQHGLNGGAAFDVYLFASNPTFQDCEFCVQAGGNGGNGGNGRIGGVGGAGGPGGSGESPPANNGGAGGIGGAGGAGGGGGGGAGGPSWCVYKAGGSVPIFLGTNSFDVFSAGSGGQPGTRPTFGCSSTPLTSLAGVGANGASGMVGP